MSDDTLATVDSDSAETKKSLVLDVGITAPSACERHVTVTISREDIDRYFGEAVTRLMPDAHVPGFRPGRAPRKVVENSFRKQLKDEVKGKLLLDAMTQVTDDQKFSAISEPDFDFAAVEIPDDGPMTFEFDVEVRPEFDMPKWRGLKIERPHRDFSEADIDHHLAKVLEQISELVPADRPAQLDDLISTDISVFHDGKLIAQFPEEQIRVRRALEFTDTRIDNFGELAQGCVPGSKIEVQAELNEGAKDPELRGEKVTLEFVVSEVLKMEPVELNSETLRRFGQFNNVGELRDAVRRELGRQLRYHQDRQVRRQITDLLTESASWELPPALLERQAHRELERSVLELRSSGFGNDEINRHLSAIGRDSNAATARALKEHFILERIAEEQEFEASEEDYEGEIALIAAQSRESERTIRTRLEKRNSMDVLRNQIIERKVLDLILSEAKIVNTPYDFKDPQITSLPFPAGSRQVSDIPDAQYGEESVDLSKPQDRAKT
jgi:trigger factor